MAEFVDGFNQLSFNPNLFTSITAEGTHSYSQLCFNALIGGQTKALVMKSYHDIGHRLSYIVLSADEALDPDNATDLPTILEYELLENEFLVKAELHGSNPTVNRIGMHCLFTKRTSWDFDKGRLSSVDPREVRISFSEAKEPKIQSFTFKISSPIKDLMTFTWNDINYTCDPAKLETTPFVLANNALSLKYKHDNVVYTMDDAANVKLLGKQKIKGVKVFEQLPELTQEPSKEAHVINKGYLDKVINSYSGSPKNMSLTVTLAGNGQNVEPGNGQFSVFCENLKIYLPDGRRLDPLYIEDSFFTRTTVTRKKLVLTLNTQDAVDPTPTLKSKAELDSYVLQEGEFFGSLVTGYEFKSIDGNWFYGGPNHDNDDPWKSYRAMGNTYFPDVPVGAYRIEIYNYNLGISHCVINITWGLGTYYGMDISDGINTSEHVFYDSGLAKNKPIRFEFSPLGKLVTLQGKQVISGEKQFKIAPKSLSFPVAENDLVTKSYVDAFTNSFPIVPNTVSGVIKGSNKGGSYCGFSYLKWLLKDGTRLDVKMVENESASNATAPVLAVWHVVNKSEAAITSPEKKTKQEIESYQLQKGEFKGTLSYYKAVGSYTSYTGEPWGSYIGTGAAGIHSGLLGFTIENLDTPLSGIEFTVGNKGEAWAYAFDTLQVSGKNGAKEYDITYPKKATNNEVVKVEIPHSAMPEIVFSDGEQRVIGKKTFTSGLKSSQMAVDDDDVINKAYATKNLVANKAKKRDYDILVKMKNDGSWVGFTHFKVLLDDGTRLDIKYLDNSYTAYNATAPLPAVFHVIKDNKLPITAPELKESAYISSYQLNEGEYKGTVSFYKAAGKFSPANSDLNPWLVYVGNQNAGNYDGIYGLHIEQLDKSLKGVNFKFGDATTDAWNYTCQQCGVLFSSALGSQEIAYTGDMTDSVEATIELPGNSPVLEYLATLEDDQIISGAKTFTKNISCEQVPSANAHLVNKKYLDDELAKLIARIEALEAKP